MPGTRSDRVQECRYMVSVEVMEVDSMTWVQDRTWRLLALPGGGLKTGSLYSTGYISLLLFASNHLEKLRGGDVR